MEKVTKKQHGLLEMLRNRLNPAIEDLGYELYDLEDLKYQGQRILRVSIDHEEGIQLEDCVRIDQKLQRLLDENDPIEEAYTLEVSSPGIFRALKNPEHFTRSNPGPIHIQSRSNPCPIWVHWVQSGSICSNKGHPSSNPGPIQVQ